MSEPGIVRDRIERTERTDGVSTPATGDRPTGRRRTDRIVGASRSTQQVVDQAMAAAGLDLPVVLTGPPGSGKNHVARAVHAWSKRGKNPLVVLSASAFSEVLLGRELFGCAAGAYPSLPEEYEGALGRAAGGTVLIDHVEEIPAPLRQAVAKALADGRYQREGDPSPRPLRARIIFTSVDPNGSPLGDAPHHGIRLLPLSDRTEDVLPLAAHFLRLYGDEEGIEPVGFTADARNALAAEAWPGNVRELAERVRHALRLAGNGAISAEALMLSADAEDVPSFKEAKRAFETRYVVGLLRRCGGNISRAARLAKKDRKDFYDVIRRTGVNPADFR